MRLPKSAHLTLRREFLAVQERGRKLHSSAYVVLALPNALGCARLGVTVSRRVGNAVVRNRVKRWAREAFRADRDALPALDIVLIARGGAASAGLLAAQRAVAAARAPMRNP